MPFGLKLVSHAEDQHLRKYSQYGMQLVGLNFSNHFLVNPQAFPVRLYENMLILIANGLHHFSGCNFMFCEASSLLVQVLSTRCIFLTLSVMAVPRHQSIS